MANKAHKMWAIYTPSGWPLYVGWYASTLIRQFIRVQDNVIGADGRSKEWRKHKRNGYRCVKVEVREITDDQ